MQMHLKQFDKISIRTCIFTYSELYTPLGMKVSTMLSSLVKMVKKGGPNYPYYPDYLMGPYKTRNGTETKRNELPRNETKRSPSHCR